MASAHAQDDSAAAEAAKETPYIDDDNPVNTVPDQQGLNRDPLRAGLLLMELASRAEEAEKEKDYLGAAKYYRALAKAVPDRALSFSKMCELYILAAQPAEARPACRRATELEGAKLTDHLRYASTILGGLPGTPEGATLSAADVAELDATFKHLEDQQVSAVEVDFLQCKLALKLEDAVRLRRCVEKLQQKQPNDALTLTHEFSLALLERNHDQAAVVIDKARAASLPEEAVKAMQDELDARTAPGPVARIGLGAGAAALLVGAGWAARNFWLRRRRRVPATA